MLDKRQQQILAVRNHAMKTRKVLCTGNPDREDTIASGVREIWPDATFIHLSKGYDFLNLGDKQKDIEELFKQHNTFINASYVKGVQTKLLEMCNKNMIVGDVFNIGTTHEYDDLGHEEYKNNKLKYKNLSITPIKIQERKVSIKKIKFGIKFVPTPNLPCCNGWNQHRYIRDCRLGKTQEDC